MDVEEKAKQLRTPLLEKKELEEKKKELEEKALEEKKKELENEEENSVEDQEKGPKPPQSSGDFEIEEEEESKVGSSVKASSAARNEDEKSPQVELPLSDLPCDEEGDVPEDAGQASQLPPRDREDPSRSQSPIAASQTSTSLLPEAPQPPLKKEVTEIQDASKLLEAEDALAEAPDQPSEEVVNIRGESERFIITGKLIIRRRRPVQQITSETSSGQQPTNRGRFVRAKKNRVNSQTSFFFWWHDSCAWKYLMALWTAFIIYASPIQFSFHFADSIRSSVISWLDWLITFIGSVDVALTLYVSKRRGIVWTVKNIIFVVCDIIGYIPWIFIFRMVTPVKIDEPWQQIPILCYIGYFRLIIWMRMFRVRVVHNVVQELKSSWASRPKLGMFILITEFVGLSFLLTHTEGALAFFFKNIDANPSEVFHGPTSHKFFPSIYFAFVTMSSLSYGDINNNCLMVFAFLSFYCHVVSNAFHGVKQKLLAEKFETFIN